MFLFQNRRDCLFWNLQNVFLSVHSPCVCLNEEMETIDVELFLRALPLFRDQLLRLKSNLWETGNSSFFVSGRLVPVEQVYVNLDSKNRGNLSQVPQESHSARCLFLGQTFSLQKPRLSWSHRKKYFQNYWKYFIETFGLISHQSY